MRLVRALAGVGLLMAAGGGGLGEPTASKDKKPKQEPPHGKPSPPPVVSPPGAIQNVVTTVSNSTQLNAALLTVNPGDTIILNDGNYPGFTISRSGTSAAPILIK